MKIKVCWMSAGVSSFIAGWLERETIDQYIYIDIADQHPDSARFIADAEKALGKKIETLKSSEYNSVGDVCRAFRFVNSASGAKCTQVLKKRVRKQWEREHKGDEITYVWGMDCNERERAQRLSDSMPEFQHCFPLIERNLTKQDAHAIIQQLGIQRPKMYEMGYSNNNCIGCVKGGAGYWNKIRIDFPDVFADRAKMEREIGHTILKNRNGPIFLDELSPTAGIEQTEITQDCSIFCELALQEGGHT